MPMSGAAEGVPAALDGVVATVKAAGLHPGYELAMPSDPEGVFTASVYPHDIARDRLIHLDQYTGEVLLDLGVFDLRTLGWLAEWGVLIHMGQQFGLANQIVLLLACLASVVMSVSAIVMWWMRRPAGSLGAPAVPADWRIPHAVSLMAVAAGLFIPLVGLLPKSFDSVIDSRHAKTLRLNLSTTTRLTKLPAVPTYVMSVAQTWFGLVTDRFLGR